MSTSPRTTISTFGSAWATIPSGVQSMSHGLRIELRAHPFGSGAPGWIDATLAGSLERLLARHFPPYVADLVRLTAPDELLLQPIYDELVPAYVADGVLLIGDAATVTRPHTASGATKALQDALALERSCVESASWPDVLASYDAERCAAGAGLVELGRRIGREQVQQTPEWGAMTAETMAAWTKAMLSGEKLYFYGDSTVE